MWYFLNEIENGTPMGKFANMPNILLAIGRDWPKATWWEISWIAVLNGYVILDADKMFLKYYVPTQHQWMINNSAKTIG